MTNGRSWFRSSSAVAHGQVLDARDSGHKDIRPLLALCLVVFTLWSFWAISGAKFTYFRSSHSREVVSGLIARAALWGAPCFYYLRREWGPRWAFPLGLGFPLGKGQVIRTAVLSVFLTITLFAATAARTSVSVADEVQFFLSSAQLRLTAPVLEELMFRGVILSELLNWTHQNSRSPFGLRSRYLLAQLGCAVFFVLIHWPGWWTFLGYQQALERSLPIFAVGLVFGFVFAHTRSIWPCIWLHWLNNELSLMASTLG